ncbi:stage V sporulation protein AA [Salinibacillus xinjiangensis]|uniref:Stage V sporulation protein AA n=1 Tax=Salinibacillus xinjiangensis TaxID=1229268 RepID=A0A6G1X6N1_9BACI|nr:stage V sporulation protein AA [Salinibacillus xinjiangensis]MRG86468.1 stage V sporulation protein AA [Salinibacillus xinjiangensis]
MGDQVYIRLRNKTKIPKEKKILLKDIAYISASETWKKQLENAFIYQVKKEDKNIVVFDIFSIIELLSQQHPNLEFQSIGPNQTIAYIAIPNKHPHFSLVAFIWLLLFIGSGMAIMNFHYDVSMQEVQQKLHYMITGHQDKYPLWLQIPYSVGLGLGMILFFNHVFQKRINEEPSPLEVEIHNYQQNLDQYVTIHENELRKKDDD